MRTSRLTLLTAFLCGLLAPGVVGVAAGSADATSGWPTVAAAATVGGATGVAAAVYGLTVAALRRQIRRRGRAQLVLGALADPGVGGR